MEQRSLNDKNTPNATHGSAPSGEQPEGSALPSGTSWKDGHDYGYQLGKVIGQQLRLYPKWNRSLVIEKLSEVTDFAGLELESDPFFMKNHILKAELEKVCRFIEGEAQKQRVAS